MRNRPSGRGCGGTCAVAAGPGAYCACVVQSRQEVDGTTPNSKSRMSGNRLGGEVRMSCSTAGCNRLHMRSASSKGRMPHPLSPPPPRSIPRMRNTAPVWRRRHAVKRLRMRSDRQARAQLCASPSPTPTPSKPRVHSTAQGCLGTAHVPMYRLTGGGGNGRACAHPCRLDLKASRKAKASFSRFSALKEKPLLIC